MIRIAFLTLLIATSNYIATHAQVQPANRSVLNYRLIGFSVPEKEGITAYEFEVSEMIITDTGNTVYKPVFKKKTDKHQLIETLPEFGKTYRWNINYYKGDKITETEGPWMFLTNYSPYIDTSKFRLRIIKNEVENKDILVFLDGTQTLYNLSGDPLWYLPLIPGIVEKDTRVRDLHITPQNTITFLTDNNAYEIDYNGNILWEAPNDGTIGGDSTEQYHHQFTRLPNGNYMIAGRDVITREIPDVKNPDVYYHQSDVFEKNGKYYKKIYSGTLIEYSPDKKVVWSWKASEHFSNNDFFKRTLQGGAVNTHTHMNCFYFNLKDKSVYIGFRDINRIIKISYPKGNIIAQYGEDYTNDKVVTGPSIFKSHHNNTIIQEGDILLYNNNVNQKVSIEGNKMSVSSVQIIAEPIGDNKNISLKWEFKCDFDPSEQSYSLTGGSAFELQNKDILVTMGSVSRNFIVTRDKKIIWDSKLETYSTEKQSWSNNGNYRITPVESQHALNSLIFNPQNKQVATKR